MYNITLRRKQRVRDTHQFIMMSPHDVKSTLHDLTFRVYILTQDVRTASNGNRCASSREETELRVTEKEKKNLRCRLLYTSTIKSLLIYKDNIPDPNLYFFPRICAAIWTKFARAINFSARFFLFPTDDDDDDETIEISMRRGVKSEFSRYHDASD